MGDRTKVVVAERTRGNKSLRGEKKNTVTNSSQNECSQDTMSLFKLGHCSNNQNLGD